MLIGKTQSQGSGVVETIKNWLHNQADALRHFKIEFFGKPEDKDNLKKLDEFNTKIMEFHMETRKIEFSIRDALHEKNTAKKGELYTSIAALRESLKAQKTAVKAIVIGDTTKSEFIARKRSEEIELIDNKLEQLSRLESEINTKFRSI